MLSIGTRFEMLPLKRWNKNNNTYISNLWNIRFV